MVEDLPSTIRRGSFGRETRISDSQLVSVDEVERRHILSVLRAVGGNKTAAARILGLDRKTLYRKLKQYGAVQDTDPELRSLSIGN